MRVDKRGRAFTLVATPCFLAAEFIAAWRWCSRENQVLWWLLLPTAVCVALFVFTRRANRQCGRGR